MNYPNKTPKELIVEIRDAVGMTDTEIGDATKISQSTISRLRSGVLTDTSSENWRNLVALHDKKVPKQARKVAA